MYTYALLTAHLCHSYNSKCRLMSVANNNNVYTKINKILNQKVHFYDLKYTHSVQYK